MPRILNRVGALLGVLFLVSVLDTAFSGYMEPKSLCRIFPGGTEFVSGKISADRITSLEDLKFVADTPLLTVEFVEAKGRLWRGKAHASSSMEAGTYHFKTLLKWQQPAEEESEYTVKVFSDEAAYRNSFRSFLRRFLGVAPWLITAVSFPLLLVCLMLSFRISTQREAHLNEEGLATVFKVTRSKDSCEVSFGFGEKDGIRVGDSMWLMNRSWQPVGEVKVKKVGNLYATAEVDPSIFVKPDYLVGKKK